MTPTALSQAALVGQSLAADLDRRLAHVLEPAMRRRLVAEALATVTPESACALLAVVIRRAPSSRGTLLDPLRDAVHELLAESDPEESLLPYALRSAIYAAAREIGEEGAAALLRASPQPEPDARPRLPRELDEIPLGRRRSLARGEEGQRLELLSRDLDPVVIRHVLRNARVREGDVVRMAATTPNLASTLEEIARSPRWAQNRRVRVAVARNPVCPLPLAARLVPALPRAELAEMGRDPRILEDARELALRELRRRARVGGDGDGDGDPE